MNPKPLDLEELQNIYKKIKIDFGSGKPKVIYDEKEAKKEIIQRLKSAVQGLLEDIENYFKSQIDEEDSEHISFCYICDKAVLGRKQHIEYHLKPIREKIKKWFPDVVCEDD